MWGGFLKLSNFFKQAREPKTETQTHNSAAFYKFSCLVVSGEEEDETIFPPSDRAKGSAECLIMILPLLKPSLPLHLWLDIFFMRTQEKYLVDSGCTFHSISLSDNGFLQMPTATVRAGKKKKKNYRKVSEQLGCVYSDICMVINLDVMFFYSNQIVNR